LRDRHRNSCSPISQQLQPDIATAAVQSGVDAVKLHAHVDRERSLPVDVIASARAPAIRGEHAARSFEFVRELPDGKPWAPFSRGDLEMWLVAMAAPPGAA
jgi:hypothetical protein